MYSKRRHLITEYEYNSRIWYSVSYVLNNVNEGVLVFSMAELANLVDTSKT